MNLQVLLEVGPDRHAKERVAALLAACPWSWPRGGAAADHAADCAGAPSPAASLPGYAPVLARSRTGGTALCCVAGGAAPGLSRHDVAPAVERETSSVRAALSRCLPLRSAGPGRTAFFVIDSTAPDVPRLQGRSVGLSVALALAGATLGRAVPTDLACSATVEQGGQLGGVDSWPEKVQALGLLPQVERLLVAPCDVDEVRAVLAEVRARPIEVVGCPTLHDALSLAFGEDYPVAAAQRRSAEDRAALIESLFVDALKGTASFIDWEPASQVTGAALKWPELDEQRRGKLLFAHAVATRYARELVEPDLPDEAWCRALRPGVVHQVLAHVFQHHARWGGQPSSWALESIAAIQAQPPAPGTLKVRGAWARWIDGAGQHRRALDEHEAIVADWLDRYEFREASYSLCEWLRLAGALGRVGSFDEADRIAARLEANGWIDDLGLMYVRVARAQGAWALSLSGDCEALSGRARAELERVLQGDAARPNWSGRIKAVVLRYQALLGVDVELSALREDPVSRDLVALHRDQLDLQGWLASLPPPCLWRARPLAELGVEHVLRFFVDA